MKKDYQNLTLRNLGYIGAHLQERISTTRVLIAGCGIGSQVAEAAARIGFQNFLLVDGDSVGIHNLNRQSFLHRQIGQFKCEALRENILAINPNANVVARVAMITPENAQLMVAEADLVFDTIDFLDLEAIVAVHDAAHAQKKLLVSSFAAGFGAAVINLPPSERDHAWIREIFDLPLKGSVRGISYVERYGKLFAKLAPQLDPQVVQVMQKVFRDLADGKPCPAPQVAPGAHAVAAACTTAAIRLLEGSPVTCGPEMVVVNLSGLIQQAGILLVPPSSQQLKAA